MIALIMRASLEREGQENKLFQLELTTYEDYDLTFSITEDGNQDFQLDFNADRREWERIKDFVEEGFRKGKQQREESESNLEKRQKEVEESSLMKLETIRNIVTKKLSKIVPPEVLQSEDWKRVKDILKSED